MAAEKNYGYGHWEYRHVCKGCGHTVRPPKNKTPCSRCGGDFGPRISMRKLFLEPEKPPEIIEIEYIVEPAWWEVLLRLLGFRIHARIATRKEKRAAIRKWRWQTYSEVEEDTGIIRHDNFFDDDN